MQIQTTLLFMAGFVIFLNLINEIKDKSKDNKWDYYMFGAIVVAFAILNLGFFKVLSYLFISSFVSVFYKIIFGFDLPTWLLVIFMLLNWQSLLVFISSSVIFGALNKLFKIKESSHILLVSMLFGMKYGTL